MLTCSKKDTTPKNVEVHDFVWKGLNAYYLWQSSISDLADSRFKNDEQRYSYLANSGTPEELFESLLNRPTDRFSWIVDDYITLENSFQGIGLSNGMEFELIRNKDTPTNIFGYVRYVIPNSDAAAKGVLRGMIFAAVNDTQLTESNYRDLLFNANEYTINLANYNAGNPILNGNTIVLTKTQIQENPVAITKTFEEGNHKIGYLMYNQFSSSFDGELNAAFGTLKAENVTDLIVDLRYNGGGSVKTAVYLGSMITGQFNGQLYSKQVWNEKALASFNPNVLINNFTNEILNKDNDGNIILQEPLNSLELQTVYFIVSGSSASASELVINALSPYITVKLVGTTTVGKVQGSALLYDSDNYEKNGSNFNSNHRYAMLPIILEIQNKNGQNKPEGYTPEVELKEDYGNLGILGEKSDPLLDRAITYILTGARQRSTTSSFQLKEVTNTKLESPTRNNMYVELKKAN